MLAASSLPNTKHELTPPPHLNLDIGTRQPARHPAAESNRGGFGLTRLLALLSHTIQKSVSAFVSSMGRASRTYIFVY